MADNKILEAVQQLDRNNDNHWTSDGLPRIEAVRELAGDAALTRAQINEAAPDFKRPKDEVPTAPPAPPAPQPWASTVPPTPTVPPAPPTVNAPEQDEGLRGDLGPLTAPEVPAAPVLAGAGQPVPPVNVDGEDLAQSEPLPIAPAADGLPTAREPIAIEGAPGVGLTVDDVSGRSGPGGEPIPEIAQGTTMQGTNKLATSESDLQDALATTAPSANAPTTLGGPLEPGDLQGINADGLRSTADATGEAQLPSLDRGHPGDPDALPALQEELAQAEAASGDLRAQVDELTGKLNEAAANESRIRAAIEAATPRTGHMQAIQGFFGAQDQRAEQVAAARQKILDSGVDLKALGRLTQRSPLDAAKQGQ